MSKTCSKCGQEKSLDQFYKHLKSKGGYRSYCKSCSKLYEQERYTRLKNEGHVYIKNKRRTTLSYNYRVNFGITEDQYNELLEKQDHKCAVCETHVDDHRTRLHIDHNHSTGEIRGLLCQKCNTTLISDYETPDIFQKAINYMLKKHTGWFVPNKEKENNGDTPCSP